MLQHILNPAFLYSFEKGEGEQLLGPPNPEGDNPESITSVFITKVTILVYIQVFENKKLFLSFCFSILICISCSISKYYDQLYQITYITLNCCEIHQSSVGLDYNFQFMISLGLECLSLEVGLIWL